MWLSTRPDHIERPGKQRKIEEREQVTLYTFFVQTPRSVFGTHRKQVSWVKGFPRFSVLVSSMARAMVVLEGPPSVDNTTYVTASTLPIDC